MKQKRILIDSKHFERKIKTTEKINCCYYGFSRNEMFTAWIKKSWKRKINRNNYESRLLRKLQDVQKSSSDSRDKKSDLAQRVKNWSIFRYRLLPKVNCCNYALKHDCLLFTDEKYWCMYRKLLHINDLQQLVCDRKLNKIYMSEAWAVLRDSMLQNRKRSTSTKIKRWNKCWII